MTTATDTQREEEWPEIERKYEATAKEIEIKMNETD